ncbi:hypothetical protein SAMN04489867_1600 [Pedococcus dokdonensis]|uniref:Galactose oxidase, central domain n=1 Tax=Pedococcus dokdonensis TaxID=443156 RepID=A0A1H0QI78_9MICO|nr:hypothetical protein [Pedococcus dokdonensis]SDP16459.1 hypothetical protein SAMN04489867_1600 [Pedococcus dokdonensis]
MRRWRRALAATLLLGGAACTAGPAPPPAPAPAPLDWTVVDLPDGAVPLLVRAGGDGFLVAARTGERASMYRLPSSVTGAPEPVTVEPHSVYAPAARWVDLATDGARVLALGRASGGAHGLPRWTVWDGTPTRLVERPQPFEAFGGPRSGGLAAVGLGRSEVLVGTWDDDGAGLDARVWTRSAPTTWERVPVAPALASTVRLLPQPAAVASSPASLLVAGSVTDLGEGASVVTRAAAWVAPDATGPWEALELPATTVSARATGVACGGHDCWVAGTDGEAPAAWRVVGTTVTPQHLPAGPGTSDLPPAVAAVAAVEGHAWMAYAVQSRSRLARTAGRGWVGVEGPPGRPVSLAAVPGRLYLVAVAADGPHLWTAAAG